MLTEAYEQNVMPRAIITTDKEYSNNEYFRIYGKRNPPFNDMIRWNINSYKKLIKYRFLL